MGNLFSTFADGQMNGISPSSGVPPRARSIGAAGSAASAPSDKPAWSIATWARLGVRPCLHRRCLAGRLCAGHGQPAQRERCRMPGGRRCLLAKLGISIERVMTDNGSCYRSTAFRAARKRTGRTGSCLTCKNGVHNAQLTRPRLDYRRAIDPGPTRLSPLLTPICSDCNKPLRFHEGF